MIMMNFDRSDFGLVLVRGRGLIHDALCNDHDGCLIVRSALFDVG